MKEQMMATVSPVTEAVRLSPDPAALRVRSLKVAQGNPSEVRRRRIRIERAGPYVQPKLVLIAFVACTSWLEAGIVSWPSRTLALT